MKKIYVTVSIAMALAVSVSAQSKFDGQSMAAISYYKGLISEPSAAHISPVELPFEINHTARGAEAEAGIIITLQPGESFDVIEAAGLTIQATIGGDMCVATGSLEDIIALEQLDAVKSLTFGGKADPMLNKARAGSFIDDVQNGTTNTLGYKGTGVICGIYDSGIDPNHINFYNADFTGSRVKAVNYFNGNSGGSISYTDPDKIAGFTTDSKNGTHGTHTLGCMTGAFCLRGNSSTTSGKPTGTAAILNSTETGVTALASTKNPYYGSAPDADIYVNCGSLYDANIIAGVSKLVDYAKSTGKPAVVNLSIGSSSGPHDGTCAVGQALERAGNDIIVCIAAGNEGEDNLSIQKTLTASDKSVKTLLDFPTNSQGIVDVYGSDTNTFDLTVAIVDKSTGTVLYQKKYNNNGSYYLTTRNYTQSNYEHANEFDAAFSNSYIQVTVANRSNGRHGVSINYTLNPSISNNSRNQVLAFFVEGSAGQRIDITNRVTSGSAALISNNFAGYSDGTPDFSISSMACGKNVICVGSWTTRVKWPTVDRSIYSYNTASNLFVDQVSAFSSYGVTYDGRSLPDICAPGAGIVSSYNSYYTGDSKLDVCRYKYKDRTYVWQTEQGTSMATPVLAGVIATWLEAKPDLKVDEIRTILKKTASPLEGGTAVQRGAGKLNAYEGLKEVLNLGAANDIKVESDIVFSSLGGNIFEVFVPGGGVSVSVYNLSGVLVKTLSTSTDTQTVDLSTVAKGIYLVNINGTETHRVAVN